MLRRTLAPLLAGVLLLAACGGDDDDGAAEEYNKAMTGLLAGGEDVQFAAEDRECLGVQFVEALGGPGAFEDAGVTPAELAKAEDLTTLGLDLGEEEARAMAGAFGNCDVSLAQMLLDEAGEDVPADVRSCVEENLDEEVLADFFARLLVEREASSEPPEAVLEPLLSCF